MLLNPAIPNPILNPEAAGELTIQIMGPSMVLSRLKIDNNITVFQVLVTLRHYTSSLAVLPIEQLHRRVIVDVHAGTCDLLSSDIDKSFPASLFVLNANPCPTIFAITIVGKCVPLYML